MAIGAPDQQKDSKKHRAPSDVYRCDPLWEQRCLGSDVGEKSQGFLNSHTSQDQAPKVSRSRSRQDWDAHAHQLLKEERPIQDLLKFLRHVPWQDFHTSQSHDRSALNKTTSEKHKDSAYAGFGMYSRGGVQGITTWTKECPWITRLLNKVIQHYDPNHTWTSVTVSFNTQTEPHRDIFNLPGSKNMAIPVIQPHHGGEIWVEATEISSSVPSKEMSCAGVLKSGHLQKRCLVLGF